MKTQDRIRLHTFHDLVAFSLEGAQETLYLKPDDALAFAAELRLFARSCKVKMWPTSRVVEHGTAYNESDGQHEPKFLP